LLPGDFADAILGQDATPEAVAALRHLLGLDRPAYITYFEWLRNVLRGDFGVSLSGYSSGTERDVASVVFPRLKNTLFLAGLAAIVAVPASIVIGLLAALYRNSMFDRASSLTALLSASLPEFFVGYVLVLLFAVMLPILPAVVDIRSNMSLLQKLIFCALPVLTMASAVGPHLMRLTRAATIGVLGTSYIEAARLKGLSPLRVVFKHALPNVVAPIATSVALSLGYLITGVVVVEVVFAYPGLGQLLVDSVTTRDIPVVQCCVLLFASIYILLNLLADIIAILSNPRAR
jgi:peptide/nickel transport system permease protein